MKRNKNLIIILVLIILQLLFINKITCAQDLREAMDNDSLIAKPSGQQSGTLSSEWAQGGSQSTTQQGQSSGKTSGQQSGTSSGLSGSSSGKKTGTTSGTTSRASSGSSVTTGTATANTGTSASSFLSAAKTFIQRGEQQKVITVDEVWRVLSPVGRLMQAIAITVLVIVGLIMGIKYMISGTDEKAKMKQRLIWYVVSAVVVFGVIGIYNLIASIVNSVGI